MSPARWQLEHYLPLLQVLARRIRFDTRLQARFDSSDVVMETVKRAHESLGQCNADNEAQLIGWLQAILANTVRDMESKERAGKRDPAREQSLDVAIARSSVRLDGLLPAPQSSPSHQAERHELLLILTRAIQLLPDEQRTVVEMRDLDGEAVKTIAAKLNCTEKTVAGLLRRGRKQLRQTMEKFQ